MKNFILFLTCFFALGSLSSQTADPFTALKQAAQKNNKEVKVLSKKVVTKDDPNFKMMKKMTIPFKPFLLEDGKGNTVSPDKMVTLENGQQITAKNFIDQLNEIERKMNLEGQTLRTENDVVVSKIVTDKRYLDSKIARFGTPISVRKTTSQVDQLFQKNREIVVGNGTVIIKPLEFDLKEENEEKNTYNYVVSRNGSISRSKVAKRKAFVRPTMPDIMVHGTPKALKIIDERVNKEYDLGNPATFQVGVRGDFRRYLRISPFDPTRPAETMSEFQFNASGRVFGSIKNHAFDFLNASAEFYAPQDTSKKMSAKVQIKAVGITIYNLSKEYKQFVDIEGFYGKEFDHSFPIVVPIVAGFNFEGKIGVRGSAGFKYKAGIYRLALVGSGQPVVDIEGYAEAGASLFGVLGGGVGGVLKFIKADLDFRMWAGIYAQNTDQIVFGLGYNADYYINMLSGYLYVYVKACLPDWLGGGCWQENMGELFKWNGFTQSGTLAEGQATVALANTWAYEEIPLEMK